MKKSILIPLLVFIAAIAGYFYFSKEDSTAEEFLTTSPESGEFVQTVFASGELKAKKSTKVSAPSGMRAVDIYQVTIKDLITEGTLVEKGQFVASLDRSEIATKLSTLNTQMETEITKLEQVKIDTAISMKEIRDQLADIEFNIVNEKLTMERNKYEPTMVLDQSKINLEKSERSLQQLRSKRKLLEIQSIAKVEEVDGMVKQLQNKINSLNELGSQFNIVAPEAGMLIYSKEWNGNKIGAGSMINAWNPVVAELPDLSKMISIAYVNEVDISKIAKGQLVDIKVDAFPEKEFTGNIINVANIGQELRNQDAKVFEITIEIKGEDEVMKPAMTTSNEIKIYKYDEVLSVPLDAFYSDSIDYVVIQEGGKLIQQEVVSGPFNEDRVIIAAGLSASDVVLLSKTTAEKVEIRSLDAESKAKAMDLLEEWKAAKKEYDKLNVESIKGPEEGLTTKSFPAGTIVISS